MANTEYTIGQLQVREMSGPASSRDAVIQSDNQLTLRIPWGLLQVTDPSLLQVLHDDTGTSSVTETVTTDGVAFALVYNNTLQGETNRFSWLAGLPSP